MPTEVKITSRVLITSCVIHMEGSIDGNNLDKLESVVEPLLKDPNNRIFIMDFKGLQFIDSRVVGYITFLYTTLNHSGRILALISPTEAVDDTLTLVGLKNLIPTFSSIDEAIKKLQ
ncbi:STAS domain-containing protein [Candidatus Peregrinibacteria bacterium]|nr:STAS domain-containing protein [Candidatus Peregrinibacteria bacterium]